ncbi:cysteine-rich receptor-like protein kinase 29 isoform X2 [Primulina eburnea]|uniref:cysteine-rich receptor-like protein kinase 29 isoform X2 n=1 Tax=Primulina eburnea TaxID=1245227 RepID=UPI003C6C556C
MGCERIWPLAFVLLFLANLLASAAGQSWCFHNGNYTNNSPYRSNLDALLSSLSTNVDDYGFYNASVGQNPDTVYASVLCRGDVQLNTCRYCTRDAATEIVRSCQNYKQAVQFNEFCTLRYYDESMFWIKDTPGKWFWFNAQNASAPQKFQRDVLNTLLLDLRGRAASGGSRQKVAAANTSTSNSQTIFALVQCTPPDLSFENCSSCLIDAALSVLDFCDGKKCCRVLTPICNIRYEVRPFYNVTRLQELETNESEATPSIMPSPVPSLPRPQGKKDDNRSRTIIVVTLVSIAASLTLAACSGILVMKWKKKKSKEELEIVQEISSSTESLHYDFGKIKAATDDFSDAKKLGKGGFGNVYLGNLPDGQELAVKRLSWDSKQGDVEFKNEVLLMAKLQHRNLVRLMGFSIQGREKLLVYEFVKNASLDRFIFDPVKRSDLGWDQRYKIIMGIAKGLLYLHEESRLKIIHRDLKASKVLLDGDMNPKIADFGLARLFLSDETEGNTSKIVGTYGYMAPEYAMHGEFSVKSDVFSFGVLVLEIMRGQKNNSIRNGENIEVPLKLGMEALEKRYNCGHDRSRAENQLWYCG